MRAEFRRDEADFFIDLMTDFIKEKKDVKGYVVYYKDAFINGERDDDGRTYLINNELSKGVQHDMHGMSIFARPLSSEKDARYERIEEDVYGESKYIEKLIIEAEEVYAYADEVQLD